MIWDNLCWIYIMQGQIYVEEAVRLTTAGHQQHFIEIHCQPALDTGITWMNRSPFVSKQTIETTLEDIRGLAYAAHQPMTPDGWNRLALQSLQTQINALVWLHDHSVVPNDDNTYQDNAVIALQSGYTIEGRDAPIPRSLSSERTTVTCLIGTNLPE